jgi:hypothetical protein
MFLEVPPSAPQYCGPLGPFWFPTLLDHDLQMRKRVGGEKIFSREDRDLTPSDEPVLGHARGLMRGLDVSERTISRWKGIALRRPARTKAWLLLNARAGSTRVPARLDEFL